MYRMLTIWYREQMCEAKLFCSRATACPLCDDARLEMNSSSSSHLVSPPKLEKNWKHLPQPVSVRPVAEINIEGAGGDSLGGAVSLEELRSRHQFTSAAEELVYIRTRLKQCAQRLEQLRLVLNPNPPT